jgi:hypothetical protein
MTDARSHRGRWATRATAHAAPIAAYTASAGTIVCG